MATAATARSNRATLVAGFLALLACVSLVAVIAAGETTLEQPWLIVFLAIAATIAVTQSVDLGCYTQFDGAQPITILAAILGGPLAGAGTGVVSTIFYTRPGGSRLTYGSVRALVGLVAGVIVVAPALRYDTAPTALGVGIATEAAAAGVALVATLLLVVVARHPGDRTLALWNLAAALLAAPLVAGLALADVHAGAGPVVFVLVPALLGVIAARVFGSAGGRGTRSRRHARTAIRSRAPTTGAGSRPRSHPRSPAATRSAWC